MFFIIDVWPHVKRHLTFILTDKRNKDDYYVFQRRSPGLRHAEEYSDEDPDEYSDEDSDEDSDESSDEDSDKYSDEYSDEDSDCRADNQSPDTYEIFTNYFYKNVHGEEDVSSDMHDVDDDDDYHDMHDKENDDYQYYQNVLDTGILEI